MPFQLGANGVVALAAVCLLWVGHADAIDLPLLYRVDGQAAGDHLGLSVADAGDVNGDGFDDLLVGARENDVRGTDAGRAYLFLGGPTSHGAADLVLSGPSAGARFGSVVAGAGDVDGDGFDDFLVAAEGLEQVLLFRGAAFPDSTPALVLHADLAGSAFGSAMAGVGDLDGDGYDDVLVGSPHHAAGGVDAGRVSLFLGGAPMDSVAEAHLDGAAGDRLGCAVAAAGDVDGDGHADAIVGACGAGPRHAGLAYLLRGAEPFTLQIDLTYGGEMAGDDFGFAVARAGDVDGDGRDDLLVGAPLNDTQGTQAGRAYLFLGGAPPDSIPDLVIGGASGVDEMGYSLAAAGDVDGDGFDDWMVAAPLNETGGAKAGRVYLFLGGPLRDAIADGTFTGPAAVDELGISLAYLPRHAGPHRDALAVGAWLDDAGGLDAGSAFVFAQRGVPVAHGSLRAWREGEDVVLAWWVSAGVDPWRLQLLRRTESSRWSTVAAALATTDGTTGEWRDAGADHATLHYQLVLADGGWDQPLAQVDLTGASSNAEPAGAELTILSIAPSPLTQSSIVRIAGRTRPREIQILDLRGRCVARVPVPATGGPLDQVPIMGRDADGRPLASGVYFVRAVGGSERPIASTTRKLVILGPGH